MTKLCSEARGIRHVYTNSFQFFYPVSYSINTFSVYSRDFSGMYKQNPSRNPHNKFHRAQDTMKHKFMFSSVLRSGTRMYSINYLITKCHPIYTQT